MPQKHLSKALSLCLIPIISHAQIQHVTGTVTRVKDGDTFELLYNLRKVPCRITHIDSPEKSQRYGINASDSLRQLIDRKLVNVTIHGTDLYGRKVVSITAINRVPLRVDSIMIARGWTWHGTQFCTCTEGAAWQEQARCNALGIWVGFKKCPKDPPGTQTYPCPEPIQPWVYRTLNKFNKRIYDSCN